MMRFLFQLGSLLSLFATTAIALPLDNLEQFEWSNRLIIIHAPVEKGDRLQKQLADKTVEINDRHIFWFILSPQDARSNYSGKISRNLYSRLVQDWFSQTESPIEVVLIGKDGSEKWRHEILDLPAIFAEIDAMPMRQYEIMNQ